MAYRNDITHTKAIIPNTASLLCVFDLRGYASTWNLSIAIADIVSIHAAAATCSMYRQIKHHGLLQSIFENLMVMTFGIRSVPTSKSEHDSDNKWMFLEFFKSDFQQTVIITIALPTDINTISITYTVRNPASSGANIVFRQIAQSQGVLKINNGNKKIDN